LNRLLSLNSYHYRRGGSDAVYFEHEALFASLGWEVAHMSMRHPRNLPSPWDAYFVDELEFGHLYGVRQKLAMAAKVVYSTEARRKLSALLDRFPADIAHVHCIYHHLSPSVLPLLRERGVPVVLTAHDLKIACPAYKMLNRGGICERCRGGNLLHVVAQRCVRDSLAVSALVAIESTVSRLLGLYRNNVDMVIAPSRFYAAKLAEWGWPADRLRHVPNAVDLDVLTPRTTPGDYLLYFGRLAPEKGVETLIQAAMAARLPLRIAGTGPLEQTLRQQAASASGIEFLGHVGGVALWNLVRGARAVVLPSQWYENAPMSVLEAGALGKPVVGADIGGIPELIEVGHTGWTFPSGDAMALTNLLSRVHGTPDAQLEAMGKAARHHVATHYSRERYRDSMLAVYAELGVGSGALPLRSSDGRAG
jgi:glycosyltransferase involved in cell wall biosynthesis